MANGFVDFPAVKAGVSIEQAMSFLGLKMKREGEQYRSECPVCKKGGDRALVVTPSKGAFYCFSAKKGGDCIALVAHINGTNQREAAMALSEQYLTSTDTSTSHSTSSRSTPPAKAPPTDGMQPLAHLTPNHPVIEALKLSETVCQAIGIGFTAKGKMRGRVAFPLRLPDGTLVGYLGLATNAEMQPLILLPDNLDERVSAPKSEQKPKDQADDVHTFLRLAVNNG